MNHDPVWQRYWRYLTARFRGEVQEEVDFHIAQRARELEGQGLSPEAARREAERRFGDAGKVRSRLEQIERQRGRRLTRMFGFDELKQDLRYGVRGLLKRPAFTLVAATSLALGLAVVTVVLSLVDSWLLRPLPVQHGAELVVIGGRNRATGPMASNLISLPTARDIQARKDLFQDAAAVTFTVAAARRPEAEQGRRSILLITTGNYFTVLGVPAALGRLYTPDDAHRREPVLILSYHTWESEFGSDPAVIGSPVYLNTVPYLVIGVTAREFHGTEHVFEAWGFVPSGTIGALDPTMAGVEERRGAVGFKVFARRQPGVSIQEIRSGLDVLSQQLTAAYPELEEDYRLAAFPESRARPTLEASLALPPAALVFSGLALMVLLTATVNATNLILARGSSRQTELAVRQALGASRLRVIRQMVTETMLLALLALGGGWLLARLAVGALVSIPIMALDLPVRWGISIDWRIFGLAALISLAVGLLAGIGPAIAVSRFDLQHRLREGSRGTFGKRGQRARSALVALQVAASMVVLVTAGLFAASQRQAARIDLGFQPHHVLTFGLDASLAHYNEPRARAAFDRVELAIQALPGVRATAWANSIPIASGRSVGGVADVETEATTQTSRKGTLSILTSAVSPGFFEVLRMPILEGRAFLPTDDSTHARVVIVNRRAADILWPGRSPIGQRIKLTRDGPPVEVVGVVQTSRYILIGEAPRPYLYLPLAQAYAPGVFLYARTERDPAQLVAQVPKAVAAADRDLVPFAVTTMDDGIEGSLGGMLTLRLGSAMASAIGALALILTCVGLYGVVAYSVAQRTREIGLRMALGATRWRVLRSILLQGGRLAAIGIAIGVAFALLTTRALAGLVVGVNVTDASIFLAVATALALVTLGSAYLPARRAARIEPVTALKDIEG